MAVSLCEITRENFREAVALEVAPEQREFVADNVRSLAEAWLEPKAWPRAIYADEEPVGFLMVHTRSRRDAKRRAGLTGTPRTRERGLRCAPCRTPTACCRAGCAGGG